MEYFNRDYYESQRQTEELLLIIVKQLEEQKSMLGDLSVKVDNLTEFARKYENYNEENAETLIENFTVRPEEIDTLKEDKVIGIFPEGTINRTDDIIMPFKIGAVKMAYETNSEIVPFAITGDFIDCRNPDVDVAMDFIEGAVEIAPVYYVPGNHERWVQEEYQKLCKRMENAGVKLMVNKEERIFYNDKKDKEVLPCLSIFCMIKSEN